jgi:hypothetical protein
VMMPAGVFVNYADNSDKRDRYHQLALVLFSNPRPSDRPAAMAYMFFKAPASSMPMGSPPV